MNRLSHKFVIRALVSLLYVMAYEINAASKNDGGWEVNNPKKLTSPVKLVAAYSYLDGGSLGGILEDRERRRFSFFIDRSDSKDVSRHGLYIGYTKGKIPPTAKAKFEGWNLQDFCSLLQDVIQEQFDWDPVERKLIPKHPEDFDDPRVASTFTSTAAKQLLRWTKNVAK